MPTYRVYMSTVSSFSVDVEADDPQDAIEKAYDEEPRICAQCGGWGQKWSLDLGEEWTPDMVVEEDNDVWAAKEHWTRESD